MGNDFLALAHARYSCRKIKDDVPVEPEKLDAIVEAALSAPTGCNFQPWRLWVITDPAALEKARSATGFQFGGTAMLVLGVRPDEAWTRKYDDWNIADLDGGIVGAHILLAVESLGLATTWIGKFHQDQLKESFPQMEGCRLVAMFPIGYAREDAVPAAHHAECRAEKDIVERI